MSKKLQIKISSEGKTGRIEIIGSISEWNTNNATDFRTRCQELKDNGVSSCRVYLMTIGGDCFQASEIVNILNEIFGSYEGEGGALVASAGTYIAVCASSFTMAKNGQFMVHKPSGWANGNETEIENQLTLLKNITKDYYDTYVSKLKKPEADFKAKWDAGDFWMTAHEAKDWGFVSDISGQPATIDDETAGVIRACGSPIAVTINNHKNNKEMSLQATAIALGLAADATQEQINAKIAENAKKAKDYETLQAQMEQKEKETRTAGIKAELDRAEKEHRIPATERPKWQTMFDKDFEGTKALLDGIQPVKKLSDGLQSSASGSETYQGKTFEQLQDENPELLAQLQDENPETYDALFAAWKKKNKIK
jgi:ATP-dependent protease ClpP protease subunit